MGETAAMVTLTLTDFLLARIAEDEAVARMDMLPEAPDGCALEWMTLYQGSDAAVTISTARVLAECEAKRQIVETATGFVSAAHEDDYGIGYEDAMTDALRALAAIYADHPDYREEWRP